uniref:SCP domain-containing protein n=1 Tax=Steinernema glaseri TaxID=37863 RepID=A0A1I8AME2_9BILA
MTTKKTSSLLSSYEVFREKTKPLMTSTFADCRGESLEEAAKKWCKQVIGELSRSTENTSWTSSSGALAKMASILTIPLWFSVLDTSYDGAQS